MKKTTIFAVAAACGAFTLAVPDWNQPLNAAYPNPEFTISDAVVKQQLSVSGCKSLKTTNKGDITLYDDGSYASFRYDGPNLVNTLTGSWYKVDGKGSSTIYLSLNTASVFSLLDEFDDAATANCQSKYPSLTYVSVLQPTVLFKKNTLVVKVKGNAVTGTLQLAGKQENDSKGVAPAPAVVGSFSAKVGLKGTLVTPP